MAVHRQASQFRPWVEQVAALIGDPVKRLRFLRAVTPILQPASSGGRVRTRSWLMAVLLFTAAELVILWLARSTMRF